MATTSEEIAKLETFAKNLITSQGYEYCPKHRTEDPDPSQRYGYILPRTFAESCGGVAEARGADPLQAACALMGVDFEWVK